jgi:glutathione S-transferase
MLKFYYNPVSANARRVWVTLLEKQIPFEPILLKLDGDQFSPEFSLLNPLQRVPVVIDGDVKIVESLAILDYLEAQYPHPPLMPQEPSLIARVRMVEMIALNELQPLTIPLTKELVGLPVEPAKREAAYQRILTILPFLEDLLADKTYFAGEVFTLADIVAGTLVPAVEMFGIALNSYPKLQVWVERLNQRESFQKTAITPEIVAAAIPNIKKIMESR